MTGRGSHWRHTKNLHIKRIVTIHSIHNQLWIGTYRYLNIKFEYFCACFENKNIGT